jgi:4-coumarate--CoA ligase
MSPASHITPDSKIKQGSVGPALPNTSFKIVDIHTGEPLGPGEVGELCVKGPQVNSIISSILHSPQKFGKKELI